MRNRFQLVFWLFLTAPLLAQEVPATGPKKPHVRVIGASVSGGFRDGPLFGGEKHGDSVTLQQVLGDWLGESARVTTHSPLEMIALFQDPERIGERQIQGVLRAKPDVVIAIDFLFWFAYGFVEQEEQRLGLFAKGLALLDRLALPVLVGDLPDMRGAAQRMLHPRQIPAPETLRLLDQRLATFVKERTTFGLIPLARFVAAIKGEGARLPLAKGPLHTRPNALLQGDRLHATRLGMALLGHTIQDPLRALLPAEHPARGEQAPFERFVEAAGAEDEFEALRAAAKAAPEGADAPGPRGGPGAEKRQGMIR